MGTNPAPPLAPASAREAIEMMHAGLGWLAAADAAALGAQTQAWCLRALEEAAAAGTAARAAVLAAFTAGQGYAADADYSPRAWLMHKTGITKGAAAGHLAWSRRQAAHPQVVAALASREISESYGRAICQWTDKLPAGSGRPRTRSWSPPLGPGWACRTWPRWRRSCMSGPGPMPRMRIRGWRSRTGRCGWRPPSGVPGCWAGT